MYIGCVKQGLIYILTCTTNCRLKQEDKFAAVMIDFTNLLGRLNIKDCILLNFKKNFQRRLFKEKLGSLFIAVIAGKSGLRPFHRHDVQSWLVKSLNKLKIAFENLLV